ncbi:MAG: Fe-S cluster assembly protein SufD, partial [Paracoccaceae bacterium]
MAAPKFNFIPAEDLISSLELPPGAAWASAARQSALSRLRAMGLPGRRDEYWKFTNPATLVQPEVPTAAAFEADEPEVFGEIDRLKLVFVDGNFDAAASDDLEMTGIEIERLVEASSRDIHWAKDLYGVLEERGQSPVSRPLAALNSAF